MGNVRNTHVMRQESNLCFPISRVASSKCLLSLQKLSKCIPLVTWTLRSLVSRWNAWSSLLGSDSRCSRFGLVDFVFEPCNLRLNSVIGVVPWSQKSHKTQVMVGPHASDFNISSIFHDPKIFLKKIFTKYSMGTCILKAGSQGTTSFPLSNPFPVGFASFWSNGPTPESVIFDGLTWPTPGVTCIYTPRVPRVPVRSWENFWAKTNKGESSSGPSATAAPEKWQLYFWQVLGWHGLVEMACHFNESLFFLKFLHQHDISSSARPSSWLCWFTWSNGSCDAPEPNCNICSWSSGFLFLARNASIISTWNIFVSASLVVPLNPNVPDLLDAGLLIG